MSKLSERQRQLLAALENVYLCEGYRSLTVSDLAEKLKCSKRSLYELAPSKQGNRPISTAADA